MATHFYTCIFLAFVTNIYFCFFLFFCGERERLSLDYGFTRDQLPHFVACCVAWRGVAVLGSRSRRVNVRITNNENERNETNETDFPKPTAVFPTQRRRRRRLRFGSASGGGSNTHTRPTTAEVEVESVECGVERAASRERKAHGTRTGPKH